MGVGVGVGSTGSTYGSPFAKVKPTLRSHMLRWLFYWPRGHSFRQVSVSRSRY